MLEQGSDFPKVTHPVSDRHRPPDTSSMFFPLSVLSPGHQPHMLVTCILPCLLSHASNVPSPGLSPVLYSNPFCREVEPCAGRSSVPPWPEVLEADLHSVRKPGCRAEPVCKMLWAWVVESREAAWGGGKWP